MDRRQFLATGVGLAALAAATPALAISKRRISELEVEAKEAMVRFRNVEPNIDNYLAAAYAYAIFPSIKKGGLVFGAAGGRGLVYREGKLIGTTKASQVTFGAQIGGQSFGQLLLFRDEPAFELFKLGKSNFGAAASAVAASEGTATTSDYVRGVRVLTVAGNGLMAEAAIGSLKYTYSPLGE